MTIIGYLIVGLFLAYLIGKKPEPPKQPKTSYPERRRQA